MAARRIAIAIVTGLLLASMSFAQEFKEFHSTEDLFTANFPGTPVVTNITWETEYGAKIPARIYAVTLPGPRIYSVTAVNYNPVEQMQKERAKSCFAGDERCSGDTSFSGAGYWKNDLRGAMIYAATKYIKNPDYRVSHYAWNYLGDQAIEANELQLINNTDKSRTHITIYMHHNWLYVNQETTPANYPPPGLFVQSIYLWESDGRRANHERVYFNGPEIDPLELNEFLRGPNDQITRRPGATKGSERAQ